ncbi:hypothetical protein EYR40_000026 [Pleurotus pulmonarius]|nr:hypothetical protein EYR40_000026 [Pleurotus pulmonarius]
MATSIIFSDPETGILVHIEVIQVKFDCSWSPGATASLHALDWSGNERERLFAARKCPKAFRWKPRRPKIRSLKDSDILIKYVKDGCERNDVVPPYSVIEEMIKRAEYDRDGEACVKIKHTFSFGAGTCWFKARRSQRYTNTKLRPNVVLEFANSQDCLHFIHAAHVSPVPICARLIRLDPNPL